MTAQRRTWQIEIKRTNNSNEPNKGVYIPVLNNERVVVEFQCDAGTYPLLSKCVEVKDVEQSKEQNPLSVED